MRADLERYWTELGDAMQAMPFAALASIEKELYACYRRGGTIFLAGNGGSAATASHMACDLAKGVRAAGAPALRVMALTDNVPLMTAWANDTSYDRIFAEQLATLGRAGDTIILISASGNSPNVVAVPEVARRLGVTVIALTGQSGGQVARLADLVARVPADLIEQVEDAHMIIAHSLCVALRKRLQREYAHRVREPRDMRDMRDTRQPALQAVALDSTFSGPLIPLTVAGDALAPDLAELTQAGA